MSPPLNSGILILAHLYLSALLLVLPCCCLISPTTFREGQIAPWAYVHLDLTELLHEQLTTVFASGWLGTSTKSINPTFCTIGLLNKSEAAISVCSSLLLDRHPSLSPSMSVWLPASNILFEAIAIGFVFNSPHSTLALQSSLLPSV